ncbi:MAG: type II toxin-antitoxin system VapC family toxin [Chloroflexi bacterium]|nr:type II toxin-antitoxin system VapC family toxin [Chloroflexota bacterium]
MAEPQPVVVDASIATRWHLTDEDHVLLSQQVLADFRANRIKLVAPDHLRHEVSSAILNATRAKPARITVEYGRSSVREILQWGIELVRDDDLLPAAFLLGRRWTTSFYDGLYLALAQKLNCPFIHADAKLAGALRGRFPNELWIEDYRPATEQ